MDIIFNISIILNVIFIIAIFVMIRAYKILDASIYEERSYLYQFFETAWKKIVEIDTRGSFAVDDEVGWFYTELKRALDILYKKVSRYL